MAFLSGIFGAQGQQQQGPQGQQQNKQQQQLPTNGNGSAGPAQGQQQQAANQQLQAEGNPSNPMDPFWKLLNPAPEVVQQQQQQQQQQAAPLFGNVKPEDISAQVKKTNFTSSIDPAKAQRALSGDAQAFMEVLNEVAQGAFQANLQMTQGLVEHGVRAGSERFNSTLDSRFKNFQLNSQNSQNPAFKHPVGKALLDTVKQQMQRANPNLPANEIQSQAESMFSEFAKLLAPQQQGESSPNQSAAQDWLSFLDGAPSQ